MRQFKCIKDYPMCPVKVGTIIDQIGWGFLYKDLCHGLHKEFWEEVKSEYPKIVEFFDTITRYYRKSNGKFTVNLQYEYSEEELLNRKSILITKVQTSENDIWTVGDRVKQPFNDKNGIINRFLICKNPREDIVGILDNGDSLGKLFASVNCHLGDVEVSKLEKSLQPLFTTDDGIEIFEGDDLYYVRVTKPSSFSLDKYFEAFKYVWEGTRCETDDYKWFSTKEAAEKYIYNNEKKFSVKDIEDAVREANYNPNFMWTNVFKQKLGI